jgi:hypothetical protein
MSIYFLSGEGWNDFREAKKGLWINPNRCRRARGDGAETKEAGDRVSQGLAGKLPHPLWHMGGVC